MKIQLLKKKRFSELDTSQKRWLKNNGYINGCGSKAGWIKPPNLKFGASCDHHDWNYFRGGTETERYKADFEFYLAMLEDAHKSGWYFFYRTWAYTYFRAVRWFGYKHFAYNVL